MLFQHLGDAGIHRFGVRDIRIVSCNFRDAAFTSVDCRFASIQSNSPFSIWVFLDKCIDKKLILLFSFVL